MSYLHVLSWTPGIQKRWGDTDGKGWTETIPEENQTEVEVCGPHLERRIFQLCVLILVEMEEKVGTF